MKKLFLINKIIRRLINGTYLEQTGKQEGVLESNFCQSVLSARRPPPFGRREKDGMSAPACVAPFQRTLAEVAVGFSKNLWRLASRCFKVSPNLFIEAAPNGKFQFFCGGSPRKTQFHGGFLADDVEVRRAERGIKPNGKMNRIPFGFIANFLLFAEGKTSKFPVKESDNFSVRSTVCPKAITN
ncbi:MAG: hypothetical protein WC653_01560 [Candidatus Gracilibacteria bacterium]